MEELKYFNQTYPVKIDDVEFKVTTFSDDIINDWQLDEILVHGYALIECQSTNFSILLANKKIQLISATPIEELGEYDVEEDGAISAVPQWHGLINTICEYLVKNHRDLIYSQDGETK